MIAGKVWGTTELIEQNGVLEFHRIVIDKGGVCSKHKHEYKWNGFMVETGSLLIRVWQDDYDLVDETIVNPGEYTKVKPGLYHQFEALERTVGYELYWAEFKHQDIVRETVGHVKGSVYKSNELSSDPEKWKGVDAEKEMNKLPHYIEDDDLAEYHEHLRKITGKRPLFD